MKLAISIWNERIAPVFDVSARCLILETQNQERTTVVLADLDAEQKASFLFNCGVTTLLCGAISQEYENELLEMNIDTIPFIAGEIEQVLEAWKEGRLERKKFSMPGCGCPKRRCRRRGGRNSSLFVNNKGDTRI